MSLLQVNPCKHNTVQDILTCVFPAIKSTDNEPTPAITSKTIGYIHALVMDTLTVESPSILPKLSTLVHFKTRR